MVQQEEQTNDDLKQEWRTHIGHPIYNIIIDIKKRVFSRLNLKDACLNIVFFLKLNLLELMMP